MGKQIQFELWDDCNSKCTFCHLCNKNNGSSVDEKIYSINNAIKIVSDLLIYPDFYTIVLFGVEFFQGELNIPLLNSKFMELMKIINWLLKEKYIKNVWINATLTIGDQKDLYETLEIFKDHIENVWVLTSYDTLGRFHTSKMLENWDYHMKHIYELYPQIKLNITTILSDDCITKYLNGELSFQNMMKEYHNSFFFKVPALQKEFFKNNKEMNDKIGNFFPERKKFIRFLTKFRKEESDEMWNKLFDIHYRASDLYCLEKGDILKITRNKDTYMEDIFNISKNIPVQRDNPLLMDYEMKCGHLSNYNSYLNEDGCAVCDKMLIDSIYK